MKKAVDPRVDLGTVRGWLTGSAAGTPTFLLLVRDEEIQYATPGGLQKWLDSAPVNARSRTAGMPNLPLWRFEATRFGTVMDLWSRYQSVLFLLPDLESAINKLQQPAVQDVAAWTASVATGCLALANASAESVEAWWYRDGGLSLYKDAYSALDFDSRFASLEERVKLAISEKAHSTGWTVEVPTGAYTMQSDPHACVEAAGGMLRELLGVWAGSAPSA